MSDVAAAFLIWLPTGTLLPFVVSRLTGAGWRGAFIEASIFACLGLLIYPTMLALLTIRFIHYDSPEPLFIAGYLLAFLSLLLYRRRARGTNTYRRP
ncbi:MAG TPA: hypothetical protein VHA53_09795 [Nitrolancea sp.]|jgi:hypothetical protein|nr:hypothetical protein [Nitrolancea sp.]